MKPQCCFPPKFKPVTHVIFDMDGTILDTEGIFREAMASIGARYGKTFTSEMKNKIAGSIIVDTAKTAVKEMDLPMSWEEFLQEYMDMAKVKLPDAGFMPGAERLIRHLHAHHIPIAVATSSHHDEVEIKTANKRHIFDLFHHVVCGSSDPEIKLGKPAPDIFLVCASRFPDRPKPSQCLVLEDAINGVRGALKAGMQAIMIPDETVPYELWKEATLRLDSIECMVPELFGLPSFQGEEGAANAAVVRKPSELSPAEIEDAEQQELYFSSNVI